MSSTQQHSSTYRQKDGVDDDDFEIIDDIDSAETASNIPDTAELPPWKIAVIDDDPDVHQTTRYCLQGQKVLGRKLTLCHANSAKEGLALFRAHSDIAAALVDVVMETPDAGLQLVRAIREEGHTITRLILRTGQPGYAPELSVIQEYDINDYRTKTELTNVRLLCALTTALRSYSQLVTISAIRTGLEQIVHSMANLFTESSLAQFSRGVLTQLAALLRIPANGLVCIGPRNAPWSTCLNSMTVISDAGNLAGAGGRPLSEVNDPRIHSAFNRLQGGGEDVVVDSHIAFALRSKRGDQLFIFVDTSEPISQPDLSLLKVFSVNVAVSFDNIQMVERLDKLAYVDLPTGLPNTNALIRDLQRAAAHSPPECLAIARFEELDFIVSTYGQEVGQDFCVAQAKRLAENVNGVSLIARVGESTVGMLFDPQRCTADTLHQTLTQALLIKRGLSMSMSVTMTVIDLPTELDGEAVYRDAMAALTVAQQKAKGGVRHHGEVEQREVKERASLHPALLKALSHGSELTIALQPKVDIEEGVFIGLEALARWQMDGKFISPAKFIPIVESSGLARRLRDTVVDEVGRWSQQRASAGMPPLPVAVNLSLCDVHSKGFSDSLLKRVYASGLTPQTLHFEITESGMMESFETTSRELTVLRQEGFRIAVDDFGTGYSSLSYLERLPIDTLKIDRCFIETLGVESAMRSIAGTTIAMARSLNLDIVAEGVETPEQHQALRFLGCEVCQGYLYAPPVLAKDFAHRYSGWSLQGALQAKCA